MKLSRKELIGASAVALYIIFFASSPPDLIRAVLSHPVTLALVVAGATYVTVSVSKTVGIILILAILLSMTSVTEHLTAKGSDGKDVNLPDGKIYKCQGSSEFGIVEGDKLRGFSSPTVAASYSPSWSSDAVAIDCTGLARGDGITSPKQSASAVPATRPTPAVAAASLPITTPTAATPAPPVPTLTTTPTAPVMACNLENFENFAEF